MCTARLLTFQWRIPYNLINIYDLCPSVNFHFKTWRSPGIRIRNVANKNAETRPVYHLTICSHARKLTSRPFVHTWQHIELPSINLIKSKFVNYGLTGYVLTQFKYAPNFAVRHSELLTQMTCSIFSFNSSQQMSHRPIVRCSML